MRLSVPRGRALAVPTSGLERFAVSQKKTGFPESLSNLLGAGNGDDEEREL